MSYPVFPGSQLPVPSSITPAFPFLPFSCLPDPRSGPLPLLDPVPACFRPFPR